MYNNIAAKANQLAGSDLFIRAIRQLTSSRSLTGTRAASNSTGSSSNVITKVGPSQPSVKEPETRDLQEMKPTNRALMYPDSMDWLDERLVRISRPSKNVMQSGTAYTKTWKIEFNSQQRWENWLMGWTSSADPVSNLSLTFPTKELAIEFCERNQLQWFVEEQPERKLRRKSYADNFSWNKRTRLGSK